MQTRQARPGGRRGRSRRGCRGSVHQRSGRLGRVRAREGHLEPEGAALAGLALGADRPVHQLHQALADGQTQPGTAVVSADTGIGLSEGGEQRGQDLGCDADPGIAHREAQPYGGLARRAPLHAHDDLTPAGELDGIADQIEQHLLQPQGIAHQPPQGCGRQLQTQSEALGPGGTAHQAVEPGQQRVQVEGPGLEPELAGLDLGEVEDVVEDGEQQLA